MAKKKDTTDTKSRRCPNCNGTELACRLLARDTKQPCCRQCEHPKKGEK